MPQDNVKSFETEAFKKRLTLLVDAAAVSDRDFADVVYEAMSKYGVAEDDFRDTFGMTKGAVERWTSLKNLPQPQVRGKIIQWILGQVIKK